MATYADIPGYIALETTYYPYRKNAQGAIIPVKVYYYDHTNKVMVYESDLSQDGSNVLGYVQVNGVPYWRIYHYKGDRFIPEDKTFYSKNFQPYYNLYRNQVLLYEQVQGIEGSEDSGLVFVGESSATAKSIRVIGGSATVIGNSELDPPKTKMYRTFKVNLSASSLVTVQSKNRLRNAKASLKGSSNVVVSFPGKLYLMRLPWLRGTSEASASASKTINLKPIIEGSSEIDGRAIKIRNIKFELKGTAKIEVTHQETDFVTRLTDYIPHFYRDSHHVMEIVKAQANEVALLNAAVKDVLDNMFIFTARYNLKDWERQFDIRPDENLSIEERRARILKRLEQTPVTSKVILERLARERFPGVTVEVTENFSTYNVNIFIDILEKEVGDFSELIRRINEILPAHLELTITFAKLPSYRWVDLEEMTWRETENLTWTDIEPKGA